MGEADIPMHYVSTLDEADNLIAQHERFWVMSCGCRDERGTCARSRHDVCLMFKEGLTSDDAPPVTELSRAQVEAIVSEAREKHLVARPFRDKENADVTDGICFCCDDCCGYFLNPDYTCDKGAMVEQTNLGACAACGTCAGVCYFGARKMDESELVVHRDACYGCGLCADACPEGCVVMTGRAS